MHYNLQLQIADPHRPAITSLCHPLDAYIADNVLLNGQCHVDHEGFDINEIERHYHKQAGVALTVDNTWYKDGGGDRVTTAVLQPWISQLNKVDYGNNRLIVDHSHFVYKFPIKGAALDQVRHYAKQRPELLRIISSSFKCGLDLCVDILVGNEDNATLQPLFHIEWDFDNYDDMEAASKLVVARVTNDKWLDLIPAILQYNEYARDNRISAFEQADYRANLMFGEKSYRLIATL